MFLVLEGKIYDPADIEIVNRFNGVEVNDITDEVIESVIAALVVLTGLTEQETLRIIGQFLGGAP